MSLNVTGCRQTSVQCFLGSDDKPYNCEKKTYTSKEWEELRKKVDPKRIVVRSIDQVTGKGWSVDHVVLPPNVSLLSEIRDATTPQSDYYERPIYTEKNLVTKLNDWPEVQCCNEWVALVRIDIKTTIAIPENVSAGTQEAYVIGVGPGVAVNGTRVPSQLKYGDKVFYSGAVNFSMQFDDDKGKKIDVNFVSERNIVCKF